MFINIYCFAIVKVSLSRFLFQIKAEFLCTALNVLQGEICPVLFYALKLFGNGVERVGSGQSFGWSSVAI